jgi:tRNA threonylcarbamoyladenosine biosynthesis protein TsaB
MLLLAADTSGKHGSIALAQAEAGEGARPTRVIEVVPLAGGTFSAQLVPQIAALLKKTGFTKNDIAGFVVVSGPGSFTGLRVGLAAIKGLAEILDKPIVTVSLLEAIALTSGLQDRVTAILDAGRGEVYVGEFQLADSSAMMVSERLVRKEEVLASEAAKLVTSDEVLGNWARAMGRKAEVVRAIDAGTIARLGWRKLLAGETVTTEELEANYIRRADAEIFAKGSG